MNASILQRLATVRGFNWELMGGASSKEMSRIDDAVVALTVPTVEAVERCLPGCDCGSEEENIDAAICSAASAGLDPSVALSIVR